MTATGFCLPRAGLSGRGRRSGGRRQAVLGCDRHGEDVVEGVVRRLHPVRAGRGEGAVRSDEVLVLEALRKVLAQVAHQEAGEVGAPPGLTQGALRAEHAVLREVSQRARHSLWRQQRGGVRHFAVEVGELLRGGSEGLERVADGGAVRRVGGDAVVGRDGGGALAVQRELRQVDGVTQQHIGHRRFDGPIPVWDAQLSGRPPRRVQIAADQAVVHQVISADADGAFCQVHVRPMPGLQGRARGQEL